VLPASGVADERASLGVDRLDAVGPIAAVGGGENLGGQRSAGVDNKILMRTLMLPQIGRAWTVLASALALVVFSSSVLAASPTPAALGITETLTTSGYSFTTGATTPPGATARAGLSLPTSFPATFSITNHTTSPIQFEIPTPVVGPGVGAIVAPTIVFTVYDANGDVVWSSMGSAVTTVTTHPVARTLGSKATWKETVQVPLKLASGQFLDGTYTLVGAVNGTPDFSSTATFHVALAP